MQLERLFCDLEGLTHYIVVVVLLSLTVVCRSLLMASDHTDITDYNYFDVEDFSVDSFFRSLELQSRFATSDLEFSFPADLENVPISSCLTSVGFLDSTAAKSAEVAVVEDGHECCSSVAETSVTEDSEDANATAVVSFFRSLELQLRSCLLRTDDDSVQDSPCRSRDKTDAINNLFTNSQQTHTSDAGNVEQKTDLSVSRHETDANICHGSQSSVSLPEKSTNLNYLSSTWTCPSENYCGIEQSSSIVVSQSVTRAALTSTYPLQVAPESSWSGQCSELCEPTSAADHNNPCKVDSLCSEEQLATATLANDTANKTERRASKGGKIQCKVCDIELSSKYSFVRHLLTPLHRRRAEGYCMTKPSEAITSTSSTEDVAYLISKHKPVQCHVCRFYADASAQLLQHLMSTSHYSQVKRKLLQCTPCQFVGRCDDIVTHVNSESHMTLVSKLSRPFVITAYRSRRHDTQISRVRTKDGKCCSDCGAKFPSASSLEIHIRRRHTRQRPFTCSVCSKSYCDNSTLRLHYRTAQHRHKCAQDLHKSVLL